MSYDVLSCDTMICYYMLCEAMLCTEMLRYDMLAYEIIILLRHALLFMAYHVVSFCVILKHSNRDHKII